MGSGLGGLHADDRVTWVSVAVGSATAVGCSSRMHGRATLRAKISGRWFQILGTSRR
jgi:hypothetical protein